MHWRCYQLKRWTVFCSQIMTRIITLTLTTLLLAGLIPHVSITVNAEVTLDDFPYKKFFAYDDYYYAIISTVEITTSSATGNYPPSGYVDFNNGMATDATTNQEWYCVKGTYANGGYNYPEAYLCVWYPTGWELRNGWQSGISLCLYPVRDELTTLPTGFPTLEFESLEAALSKTSSTTNSALNIQSSVGSSFTNYQNGTIDLAALEAELQSALSQLETLAQASGNTLSDQIAVNNAITYTQTIQQITNTENIIETQTVTPALITLLNQRRATASNAVADFYSKAKTQSETISALKDLSNSVTYLITNGSYKNIADISAINAVLDFINTSINEVQSYKELDPDVSEKSQASDAEELELLNELVSVMQDQTIENKLQDQQIAGKSSNINSILEPVWNNKYFTYLVGTCGVLIIACIILRTRYRML